MKKTGVGLDKSGSQHLFLITYSPTSKSDPKFRLMTEKQQHVCNRSTNPVSPGLLFEYIIG